MKVKEAKKIIELVESLSVLQSMKSLRNNSMTVADEIKIMKNVIKDKTDDEVLSSGVSSSFNRMKTQYAYLKDL
jgi:hypothetical protein